MANEYKVTMIAHVIFKNGLKERFSAVTEHDEDELIEMRDSVGQMRQLIRDGYRSEMKGSVSVGSAIINIVETAAVDIKIMVHQSVSGKFVEEL